jgi:hypothetical protein
MDDKTTGRTDEPPVNRLEILFLIRSYNRKEISYEEWLCLSRAWAEAMMRQYGPVCPQTEAATG